MTGLKMWGAFTVTSTIIGVAAGTQTVVGPESLTSLKWVAGALTAVALGTWRLSKAVNQLATKKDIEGMATKKDIARIEKRFEKVDERLVAGGL